MGQPHRIAGFVFLPRQDGLLNGTADRYRFETSEDGKAWTVHVDGGSFANVRNNPTRRSALCANHSALLPLHGPRRSLGQWLGQRGRVVGDPSPRKPDSLSPRALLLAAACLLSPPPRPSPPTPARRPGAGQLFVGTNYQPHDRTREQVNATSPA